MVGYVRFVKMKLRGIRHGVTKINIVPNMYV